jgi:hypothetical protein
VKIKNKLLLLSTVLLAHTTFAFEQVKILDTKTVCLGKATKCHSESHWTTRPMTASDKKINKKMPKKT